MDDKQQRLMEIFSEARTKASAEERDAYLASACGDDAGLRRHVEILLQAHTRLGDFLKPPADDPPDEYLNTVIERYQLREQIGEGGCGVVYLAEQTEPVRRKVALKIVKAGMDTKEVIARFEAERQALALMDHPNIAKVLDAGATATGRPYFVMELVKGIPITEYCDQGNLSMADRLQLFMQVCHAVQHAHQKGIIHRDLKPGNILITTMDGKPMPMIIDFGVAKALGQQLTEKTLFTAFQQIVGTPLYMSPEQATISGVDVDTCSDIYSLGVLLYELLTGFTPIDAETVRKAGLDEVRRLIREADPPRPSTRLQALVAADVRRLKSTEQPPAALNLEPPGGTSPPRLLPTRETIRKVRGDLDWIVMKALEKDRARRYETVNALRADIQRHLEQQPVLAGPPGMAYRAKKYVRRHRVGVALATSVSLALIVGLVVAWFGFKQAQRERDRAIAAETQSTQERDHALAAEAQAEKNRQQAEAAREKAQIEATRSAQVAQFMKDMLECVGPSVAMGRDTTLLHEILDQTAERIGKELTNQPDMEAELLATLGQVYREIGEYDNAETMFRTALELQKKLHGQEHTEVAALLTKLGGVLSVKGKRKEAEANLRAGLAIQRQLLGEENIQTASTLNRLGTHLRAEGKLTEAEALLRQALAVQRKLLGGDHPDTATSLVSLAILLRTRGKFPEAEQNLREALAIQKKHFAGDHPVVAHATMELGKVLAAQGKYPEAETNYLRALAIQRKILGDHPITARTVRVSVDSLVQQGRLAEAERIYRTAVEDHRKANGPAQPRLAGMAGKIAQALRQQGNLAEAESLLRERLALDSKSSAENRDIAWSMTILAGVVLKQDKFAEAEALSREALAMQRRVFSGDHPDEVVSLLYLGSALREQGRLADAESAFRESYRVWVRYRGAADANTLSVHAQLIQVLRAQSKQTEAPALSSLESSFRAGKLAEAERTIRQALAIHRKLGKEDRRLDNLLNDLARVLENQGQWAEAEMIKREELALEKRLSGEKHPFVANSLSSLAFVLAEQGKLAEARTNLLEALKMSSANDPARYYCALVQLSTSDTNSYRTITTKIAAQLQTNAPGENAHLLRWACALAPDAVPDYSPVLQATRQALAGETNTTNSYSDQQTLGALLYRAHQYDEAIDELTKTVELGERLDAKTLLTSPAYGAYFLTMAHARLGHTAKARECFQRASALDPLTTPVDTNAASLIAWNRRLTLQLLRKEAESLLKPETPDSDTD